MRLFFFSELKFPQKFEYSTLGFCICSKSTLGTISPSHSSSQVGPNKNSFIIFLLGCQVLLRQPFWFWISVPRWFSSLSSFPPSSLIFLASFQLLPSFHLLISFVFLTPSPFLPAFSRSLQCRLSRLICTSFCSWPVPP